MRAEIKIGTVKEALGKRPSKFEEPVDKPSFISVTKKRAQIQD